MRSDSLVVMRASPAVVRKPDQVVGRRGEGEDPIDERTAAMVELAQHADRLHPAEDLLHELPLPLADGVARHAASCGRRSRCRRGLGVLRHVRRDAQRAAASCTKSRVSYSLSPPIVIAAASGSSPSISSAASRSAVPVAAVTSAFDDQPVPILHQHVAQIAELRFVARAPS